MKTINKKSSLTGVATVIVLVVAISLLSSNSAAKTALYTVGTADITETVSAEGTVKPAESVDLGFDRTGRISWVGGDVGTHTSRGATLATLDASDLIAQKAQAEANVAAAQALLASLENGAKPQDVSVSQAQVANATASVTSARKTLADTLTSAYTSVDDAIHNKTDVLFTAPDSTSPNLIALTIPDSQLKSDIQSERLAITTRLASLQKALTDTTSAVNVSSDALSFIQTYLRDLASAVNSAISNASYSQANIDTYKAAISTARTNINNTITAITTASEGLSKSLTALDVVQKQLASVVSGATQDQIDAQTAAVASAKAAVDSLDAAIRKTVIASPIDGIISRQDAKVGQIVSPGTPLVSVISDTPFEIETYVPENDVAKIHVGDTASTTLDAYGPSTVFDSRVTKIDPAQTIQNGSPTYKVTLAFISKNDRIRSGMSASTLITTAQKQGVISVPSRSVFKNGTSTFVMVPQKDTFVPQIVTTGIVGTNGNTEITGGLMTGAQIQNFGN